METDGILDTKGSDFKETKEVTTALLPLGPQSAVGISDTSPLGTILMDPSPMTMRKGSTLRKEGNFIERSTFAVKPRSPAASSTRNAPVVLVERERKCDGDIMKRS